MKVKHRSREVFPVKFAVEAYVVLCHFRLFGSGAMSTLGVDQSRVRQKKDGASAEHGIRKAPPSGLVQTDSVVKEQPTCPKNGFAASGLKCTRRILDRASRLQALVFLESLLMPPLKRYTADHIITQGCSQKLTMCFPPLTPDRACG
jgi:hypothetical protein